MNKWYKVKIILKSGITLTIELTQEILVDIREISAITYDVLDNGED